jgi:hypothetical protein
MRRSNPSTGFSPPRIILLNCNASGVLKIDLKMPNTSANILTTDIATRVVKNLSIAIAS